MEFLRNADEDYAYLVIAAICVVGNVASIPLIAVAGIIWAETWRAYFYWATPGSALEVGLSFYTTVPLWFHALILVISGIAMIPVLSYAKPDEHYRDELTEIGP